MDGAHLAGAVCSCESVGAARWDVERARREAGFALVRRSHLLRCVDGRRNAVHVHSVAYHGIRGGRACASQDRRHPLPTRGMATSVQNHRPGRVRWVLPGQACMCRLCTPPLMPPSGIVQGVKRGRTHGTSPFPGTRAGGQRWTTGAREGGPQKASSLATTRAPSQVSERRALCGGRCDGCSMRAIGAVR